MEDERAGITAVCRRSGLSPAQIRYLERRGFLGRVARSGTQARRYDRRQVRFVEDVAALRSIGMTLEQASELAARDDEDRPVAPVERLRDAAAAAGKSASSHLRAAVLLVDLLNRRTGLS